MPHLALSRGQATAAHLPLLFFVCFRPTIRRPCEPAELLSSLYSVPALAISLPSLTIAIVHPCPSFALAHRLPSPIAHSCHRSPLPIACPRHRPPLPIARPCHCSPLPIACPRHCSPLPIARPCHCSPSPLFALAHCSLLPSLANISSCIPPLPSPIAHHHRHISSTRQGTHIPTMLLACYEHTYTLM